MELADRRKNRDKLIFAGVLLIAAAVLIFASKILAENPEQVHKVICMGDSITYGTGVAENRDTDSYPALLSNLLGETYEVYNYGAGGRTLQSSGNKPYSATGYIEETIKEQPDIVIIMLGTNDSKPKNWNPKEYQAEYTKLVKTLQENLKKAEIYIMIPPAAFTSGTGWEHDGVIDNEVIRTELYEIITCVGDRTKTNVIDLYAITEGHPEYYSDAVHPNREGNEVLAQAIYKAIQ